MSPWWMKNTEENEKDNLVLDHSEQEITLFANAFILLMSGFDTITNTLASVLHLLIKYPHVQDRIIEEIESTLEEDQKLSDELLHKLEYMDRAIKEALR